MASLNKTQTKQLNEALAGIVETFLYDFVPEAKRAVEGVNVAGKNVRKATKRLEVQMKEFRKLTLEAGIK